MSTPMTPAQAAQNSNRDQGGRYATKTHAEADVRLDRSAEPMAPSFDAVNVAIGGRDAGQPFDVFHIRGQEQRVLLREKDGTIIRDFRTDSFDEAVDVVKHATRLGFVGEHEDSHWRPVQMEDGTEAEHIGLDYDDVQPGLNQKAAEDLIERALPEPLRDTHTAHQDVGSDVQITGELTYGPTWTVTTRGRASGQELHLSDHAIKAPLIYSVDNTGRSRGMKTLWDAEHSHIASMEDEGDDAANLMRRTTLASIVDTYTMDEDAEYEQGSLLAQIAGRPVAGQIRHDRQRAHFHALTALQEAGVQGEELKASSYSTQMVHNAGGYSDDSATVTAVTYDSTGYRRVRSFGKNEEGEYRELEVLGLPDDSLPDEGLLEQREKALVKDGVLRTGAKAPENPLRVVKHQGFTVLHGWDEAAAG